MARILSMSSVITLTLAFGAMTSNSETLKGVSASVERESTGDRSATSVNPLDLSAALMADSSAHYYYNVDGNGGCALTVMGDQLLGELANNMVIGDVNGDGIQDILVAADLEDVGINFDAGALYVFFGGPTLTSDSIQCGAADVFISGGAPGVRLGYGLAVGDVNGDDTTDIIFGTDNASPFGYGEGAVYVIFGTAAFPDSILDPASSADVQILGPDSDAGFLPPQLGTGIATGDVNGDGISDIVAHAPGADWINIPGRGDVSATFVILGRLTWASSYLMSTDTAGISIGEPTGAVIFGADSLDAFYQSPPMSGTTFISTSSIVSCGDVNNDNFDDILIALPGGDGPGNVGDERGEVHIILGHPEIGLDTLVTNVYVQSVIDLATSADITIYGQSDGDRFLYAHSFDVNKDSIDDVLVPIRYGDGPGELRPDCGELAVFFGGSLPDSLEAPTDANVYIANRDANDRLETVVQADLDGDSNPELIYAAYRADGPGNTIPEGGEVQIFLRPDTLTGTIDLATEIVDATVFAVHPDELLGVFAGLAAGDVTGDGRDDLVVGSVNGIDTNLQVTGSFYIIDGTKFLTGDSDMDAVDDLCDNCPDIANANQADTNSNNIGDACESCCLLRGNINGEGGIDISDVTYLVAYSFKGGPPPPCAEEGNVNGEGGIDISDVTYLVGYSFKGGPAPPACP